jgi:hypothetical protein
VLRTIEELLDELDPRRTTSRAFFFRARELARATPADDPELHGLRVIMLRRLGINAARGGMEVRNAAQP